MSNEKPSATQKALLAFLDGRGPDPVAPAIHTDKLWDVDALPNGELTNLDVTPIPARDMTKQQYFAELNKRGLRMKDQQESTTGPEPDYDALAAADAAKAAALFTIVPPDPFSKHEAEIFLAYEQVLERYRLAETVGCFRCGAANRCSGCKIVVTDKLVSVTCRCGPRVYRPPTGTTDLAPVSHQPVELERTTGMLFDEQGQPMSVPTVLITPLDARVIRAYTALLARRQLVRSLFCRICHRGPLMETNAIKELVTADQIVYVCACRLRFSQTG